MSGEYPQDWTEELHVACQTLERSSGNPAMVIRLTGKFVGATGQAVPVLLLARHLAMEHGLAHEASLMGRVLSVCLMRPETGPGLDGQHHGNERGSADDASHWSIGSNRRF